MGVNLASFKNSRSYPRPAATQGFTEQKLVDTNAALAPTLILAADPNRVSATVYNRHATDTMKYAYQNDGDPIPTVAEILANGFEIIATAAIAISVAVNVWAISTTANQVPVDLDIGTG